MFSLMKYNPRTPRDLRLYFRENIPLRISAITENTEANDL